MEHQNGTFLIKYDPDSFLKCFKDKKQFTKVYYFYFFSFFHFLSLSFTPRTFYDDLTLIY